MARDVQPGHAQQFERAIATIFTCRSVIKYNASLSEEQKNELLAEIDAAAQFLQERLVANAAIDSQELLPLPALPLEEIIAISQASAGSADDDDSARETDDQRLFQGFYKLYHALLKKKDSKSVELFVSRYNEVMAKLNDLQFKIEKDSPTFFGPLVIGDEIDRVRGFVTDLYCMFTEFASAISGIVEGRDIFIDTEKVSSTSQQPEGEQRQAIFDITPLVRAQQTLAQFNRRKGPAENRVADATALLIFLEDHLDHQLEKREETVSQIKNLIKLFNDLSHLVADYEQTAALLLAQVS